ncbi:hypothetical protein [Nocardioides pantholopis]|uniref:hypothetical protein n=1 Tax=Nocardioides pantholopis TaxID=2483798 RepID=UPI000F08E870|nr:hypothetical protein [Nocardioides pantholopis]
MTHPGPDGHLASPAAPEPPPAAPAAPARDWHRDRDRPLVALGVALLATAVVLATLHGRDDGGLVGSMVAVGVLAAAGLLALAAGAHLLGRAAGRPNDPATDLVAWPGAFGAASVGLMIAVILDDAQVTAYVGGLVVLVLSGVGLALTGRAPFAVTGVLAAGVVFGQAVDDVLPLGDADDPHLIGSTLALTAFAVLAAALTWRFPIRAVSAVTAGAVTVLGFATLTGALAFESAFQVAMAPSGSGDEGADWLMSETRDLSTDGWTVLALAVLLVLFWTACAVVTGHQGFRLLVVAMAVTIVPLILIVLQSDHPARWAAVLAVAGAALLAAVAWPHRRGRPVPA